MTAPIKFRGGWLPTPEHLKVPLTPHLTALALPAKVDNYSGVKYWGMLANDNWGDCTCAAAGHILCQQTALGDKDELRPDDAEAITMYEASGFDPNAGPPGENPTDQGWTVQAALDYLRTDGWPTRAHWKIAAYGTVDTSNHNAVKQGIYEFGVLDLGMAVPESMMEQFDTTAAMPTFTVVKDSPIEGGHSIIAVGYDQDWVYVVTWGKVCRMAWSFWDAYVSEAHASIAKDWVSRTGLSLEAFGAEFAALFGGANPFAASVSRRGFLARLFG